MAEAFDAPLAHAGAELVAARERWVAGAAEQFRAELEMLGECGEGASAVLRRLGAGRSGGVGAGARGGSRRRPGPGR